MVVYEPVTCNSPISEPVGSIAGCTASCKRGPFSLTIFILGGAGYMTLYLIPSRNRELSSTSRIGFLASESLAPVISLDQISAGIYTTVGYTGIAGRGRK